MKKISSLLMLLIMMLQLIPICVSANNNDYDYFIEGESCTVGNWVVKGSQSSNVIESGASSGYAHELYTDLDSTEVNEGYYAEYQLNVTANGVYSIDACMTPTDGVWSSKVYMQVNDGEESLLEGIMFKSVSSRINWYHFGSIQLNDGVNTIRFIVRDKPSSSNYYTAFIDCFGLNRDTYRVSSISSDVAFNVFESENDVVMKINTNTPATKTQYKYWTACDLNGKRISSGFAKFEENQQSYSVNLGNLQKGYYEISSGDITAGFSVVKPLDQRVRYEDTPFALDTSFSGIMLSGNMRKFAEGYARVLGLSGVSWIRDRFRAKDFVSKSGDDYNINVNNQQLTAQLVKPYGIKISTAIEYMPDCTLSDGDYYIPTDLISSYSLYKKLASETDGVVDNWEILNEVDFGGTVASFEGPSMYSSFFKAAMLGILDANNENNTTAIIQGPAAKMGDKSEYIEMLMRNDTLKLSVADNTHEHNADNGKDYNAFSGSENVRKHIYEQNKNSVNVPVWVTEAGLSIPNSGNYTLSEQLRQAKYLITSTVESIASGTDKHFYFIGPSYQEGVNGWGMMSKGPSEYPYMLASLAAQSAMTDILGKGEYMGSILGQTDDVHGYCFDSGEKYVLIVYGEGKEKTIDISSCGSADVIYDMFGNSVSGDISNIKVTTSPCYVVFDEKPSGVSLSRREMTNTIAPVSVTDAQHIVISQKYTEGQSGGSRTDGYVISGNTSVTVEVTNLNNKTMTGKIEGSFENGWGLEQSQQSISIEPYSKKELTFNIVVDGSVSKDYLTFIGTFGNSQTTASQAMLKTRNDNAIIYEAENDFMYDIGYTKYADGINSGIAILTENIKKYNVSVEVNAPKEGLYMVHVLGSINNYPWSSNYEFVVNSKKYTVKNKGTDDCVSYWSGQYAIGWSTIENVYLNKGVNDVQFITQKNRNYGDQYLVSAYDKIVLIPVEELDTWKEAEQYSEKNGLYYPVKSSTAGDGSLMKLFTYGISEPYKDNYLKYDFSIVNSGTYDIWVKSTQPNSTERTKWKWGITNNTDDCETATVEKVVDTNTMDSNINIYWYLIKSSVPLAAGLKTVTILGDEETEANDYMMHSIDTVVVSKSGTWMPTGNSEEDKAEFVKANVLSQIDTENVSDDIVLPKIIDGDVNIVWTSDNSNVLNENGKVSQPINGLGNTTVRLTAQISCGNYSTVGSYDVTVLEKNSYYEGEIKFFDATNEEIDEFQAYTKVKAKFINETGTDMDVQVFCATYDKFTKKLLSVQKKDMMVASYKEETEEFEFSVDVAETHRNILKVFTWNNDMMPLAEATEINGKWDVLNSPVVMNNTVIISGKTDHANEKLSVMILKKNDKNYSEMNSSELLSSLEYVGEIVTDTEGKYSFTFKTDNSDDIYCVKIGGKYSASEQIF